MSQKREKIKQIALGVIAVVFVITFYMTFFKNKSTPKPAAPPSAPVAPAPIVSMDTNTRVNLKPVNLSPPEVKAADIVFEYPIRDIFKAQLPSWKPTPVIKKNAPKPLSKSEIQAIRDKLKFKGAILSAGQAVAIIDNGFFHVGDTIGSYKIVSISDSNVRIDTLRGIVTLEMIHDE